MSPVRAQVGEQEVRSFRGKQRGEVEIVDVIRISPAMRVLLDRQRARAVDPRIGPVFPTPRRNQPCTESGFKSMWNKLMKKAIAACIVTWRFTFHDLRAYYAYAAQEDARHASRPAQRPWDDGGDLRLQHRGRTGRALGPWQRSYSHRGNMVVVRLSEKPLQINGLDGVADGTRTHDNRNHNLQCRSSTGAGFRGAVGTNAARLSTIRRGLPGFYSHGMTPMLSRETRQ